MKTFVLDCRLYSKNPTGISRFTLELVKYLEGKSNNNLTLLIYSWQKLHFPKHNLIITSYSPFRILDVFKLSLRLCFYKLDFFISPFYSSVFFNPNFKKICCVMDLTYKLLPQYFSKNMFINYCKVKYLDFIVYFSLHNSSIIFSISKSTIYDLKNTFGFNSYLLYLGVNKLSSYSKTINNFNLTPNNYYLYVGNNRINKNLDFLISAHINSRTNKKLVIAGCNVKSKKNIINIINPSDSDLYHLYKNCFCFVFPSTYEGFGLPVLEALHFNKPILLSSASSLIEFSSFNLNYFSPYLSSELIEYFNNEYLIQKPANKHMLSKFSWDNMRLTLDKVLHKL